MALYLISYDVKKKTKDDYGDLYGHLELMKAVNVLESVYVVERPEHQATEIAGLLRNAVKPSDRLLVIEVTDDAGIHNLLISNEQFQAALQDARAGMKL